MPEPVRIPAQPQDAFNHYARVVADQQLGIALSFPEHLDAERLAVAVSQLVANQPVLGCRFVSAGRRAWHEPVAGAPESCLTIVVDADPWTRAIEEAGQPLEERGAHLAVTLVRGGEGDALAIRVDHTAADGQGSKAVAEMLASAYSGTLAATPPDAPAPDRSWRRLRRAAGWSRLLSAARQRADVRPTWGLAGDPDAGGVRRHQVATLDAAGFSAMRSWGKARDLTVNDLVLAAWYRALFALLDPHEGLPMVVRVSFDQRRFLDAGDPMPAASNLSSVEPVSLPRLAGESFAGTARRAHAEMEHLKRSGAGLGSAFLLEMLYRLQGYERLRRQQVSLMRRGQNAQRTYPFLSNFGVLSEERLSFAGIAPERGVVLPIACHPPMTMLGVSSYRGELTCALGFPHDAIDESVPARLLADVLGDLTLPG